MQNDLVPVILLLVLPGLYLIARLGWLRHRGIRWLAAAGAAGAIAASLPYEGIDGVFLKRIKLLLAGAATLLLVLRHVRVPWTLKPGRDVAVLAPLAGLSLVAYFNFFAFHHGTFVNWHDFSHYYLGSKYYNELGYTGLYTAMLRAEAEIYGEDLQAAAARDLETYQPVPSRRLLLRSEPVKKAFTTERWREFRRDFDFFKKALGPQYNRVLLDHGFNPTPAWALVCGTFSRLIAVRAPGGLQSLMFLDLILLAGLFTAVGSAFGRRTALLAVIYFCTLFGAGFNAIGGGFLRYLWLFCVVVGLCCLHKKRYALAGGLLAAATMGRLFPVALVVPLAFKAAALVCRRRRWPRRLGAFFASFTATAAVLFLLTGLILPRGWGHWNEFRANASLHLETLSFNFVGFTEILAYRGDAVASHQGSMEAAAFEAIKERRHAVRRAQQVLVFLPLVVLVARLSRWQTDLGATALALPLIFVGLSLSAYYYAFLLGLLLVYRRSTHFLALIFAVETATYALLLFEDRQVLVFWVYRGLLVGFLCLAILLPLLRREWRLTLRKHRPTQYATRTPTTATDPGEVKPLTSSYSSSSRFSRRK